MSGRSVVKFLLIGLMGLLLACGVFTAGVFLGASLPVAEQLRELSGPLFASLESDSLAPPTEEPVVDELFRPFWQAWEVVHEDFVDQPVDDTALMQGAIRGLMDALQDEHSSYMDPDQYLQANLPLDGSYEGIGAWVDADGEFLTIVAPMPNSPAERAGLQPGDIVIAVDGEDMTGIDGNLVIRRILGPEGTSVELTVRREGQTEPIVVTVTRERITVPSLESEMLPDGIAYLRLFTFGADTTDNLRAALQDLLNQSPQGLVLDLRGNGGGLLDTALQVTSEFIPDGVIMIERYGDGRSETYTAEPGGLATGIPMVVLIDGGSASASEIVAGAIQDRGRGFLVGETSFGKGSVQNWIPLENDAGAVRVTVARWLTPDGRQIGGAGLTPDIEVALSAEDLEAGRDPQLDRAVEALLDEIRQTASGQGEG